MVQPAPFTSTMLEAVLDQLPIGAIVLDDDAVVQRFNRYEEQLSGRRRQDVIGRSFFSDIAPCTQNIELGPKFREGIASGTLNLDVEFSFPYPYNRVARDVRIRAASVATPPRGLHVLLIEDITARKALERDNQAMMASLGTMLRRFDADGGHAASEGRADTPGEGPRAVRGCTLFADLSSFARAAKGIEPAELFRHIDARVRVAVDAVMRYGGRIDKVLGDGVLAFFADQGEGNQAVYAALRAARDMVDDRSDLARQIPFRVALDFGEVILGPVGRPEFGMTAMIGGPVTLAQRLAQVGRPQEVLLSDTVFERAEHGLVAMELSGMVVPGMQGGRAAFRMERLDLP